MAIAMPPQAVGANVRTGAVTLLSKTTNQCRDAAGRRHVSGVRCVAVSHAALNRKADGGRMPRVGLSLTN
jgi:hypothetical protein